jgi:hypothetical protein
LAGFHNPLLFQDKQNQDFLSEKPYIHILHQSAYMGMLEEADKSNRILEKFLSEN